MRQATPSASQRRRNEAGVTLVETLIALLVLSMLTASGAMMLGQTVESRSVIDERGEFYRDLDVAVSVMRQDFYSISRRPVAEPGAFDPPYILRGGRPDRRGVSLALVRTGVDNPGGVFDRSGVARVHYRLEDDGRLVRAVSRRPDATRSTPVDERTLLENVRALDWTFRRGDQPSAEWASGGLDGDAGLPDAVEALVEFEAGGRLALLFRVGELR